MQQITQDKAPMRAAMLSNDVAFRRYAATRNGFPGHQFSPTAATEHLRTVCGVFSRRNLATDNDAFQPFEEMHTDFLIWAGRS
ncbi:hypothetical protein PH5382_01262 [Phaeobacter sp. CECT 5382]|uniref:hypothetical protein n=1 Tax=Phaeobacter sp. CECT 5382 TaxID=1712645 RepID=UPI0006D94A8A|nr:hypothetical protein [Phaeobacter sp. CECT 5382]CUH87336.1 hypothetical protein PH5382_01262 [Phaeobacter sp. CECT 5382]